MPLANDLKKDIRAAQRIRLPWWGVLCLILGSVPIYWLFDRFGRVTLSLPILNCVGMLALVIIVKWKLKRHAWFWGTMIILALLHVPLVLVVPWTTRWVPALIIGAIDSVDLIVMLAILAVVEKLMEKRKTPKADEL